MIIQKHSTEEGRKWSVQSNQVCGHLAWFTYNCCTASYTPQPVDPKPTSPITLYLVCKFQSFFSFWTACDIPNIEVDTKEQVARHNQPNTYIHTNRQQHTQIQYPRHREKRGINMTHATTTTAVLKIQLLYGILHHQQT